VCLATCVLFNGFTLHMNRAQETRKKEASENRRKSIVLEKKMDRAQKAVEQSNNDQEARQEVLRKYRLLLLGLIAKCVSTSK
jgi:uncharacterized protein YlxW (UPF0749 family)